jgi:hypothetical protein
MHRVPRTCCLLLVACALCFLLLVLVLVECVACCCALCRRSLHFFKRPLLPKSTIPNARHDLGVRPRGPPAASGQRPAASGQRPGPAGRGQGQGARFVVVICAMAPAHFRLPASNGGVIPKPHLRHCKPSTATLELELAAKPSRQSITNVFGLSSVLRSQIAKRRLPAPVFTLFTHSTAVSIAM